MSGSWGVIRFGNINGNYVPGGQVDGDYTIYIDPLIHSKITEIKIKFKGEGLVDFHEYVGAGNNRRRQRFWGKETYIRMEQIVYSNTSEVALEGECKYSFNFPLPANIPSSYEGTYGRVRYTVKAKITCGKFDGKKRIMAAFSVVSPLDLNLMQVARTPISVTCDKYIGFRKPGKLIGTLTTPESGYVSGQVIPIKVTVDNATKKPINGTKVYLRQKVAFTAQYPYRKVRKQNITLAEVRLKSMDPGETRTFDATIMVPSLPPSGLCLCSIIELEYKLKADVDVGNSLSRDLKISTPVIIGTVPLVALTHTNDNPPPYPASISYEAPPSYHEATGLDEFRTMFKGKEDEFTPKYPVLNYDGKT